MLTNTLMASTVIAALAGYMYISVYGVLEMRSELRCVFCVLLGIFNTSVVEAMMCERRILKFIPNL